MTANNLGDVKYNGRRDTMKLGLRESKVGTVRFADRKLVFSGIRPQRLSLAKRYVKRFLQTLRRLP